MKPTPAQQKAIDSNTSCVVAAGAGSGKTKVLSMRFLRLVQEKRANCDQILTITFTKKATAEMKERIHKVLLESGMTDQLKLFPNAWISTVDSFCADVVRTGCSDYNLSSDFKMLDEDDFKLQAERIARKTLEDPANTAFVEKLLSYTSVDSVIELLVKLSTEFNIVKPLDAEESVRKQVSSAKDLIEDLKDQYRGLAEEFYDLTSDNSKFDPDNDRLREAVEKLDSDTVYAVGFNFSKTQGTKDKKEDIKLVKEEIKSLKERIINVQSVIDSSDFALEFYRFVCSFENRINLYKIENSSVVFSDVLQMAIDILTRNKAIRNKFKNLFKYVMIDEFQDNNDDYRKLLYLLCEKYSITGNGVPSAEDLEEGKIFLVGDEKQSIYRFRGADVSVFKRMSDEIKKSNGQLIELGDNFRSEPELVEFFNAMFKNVMKNPTEGFEASYRELGYRAPGSVPSRIMFHYFVREYKIDYKAYEEELGCQVADSHQSEAYSIANLIDEICNTDKWLIEVEENKEKVVRRPRYNEVAILFRSTTHQADYEKALRLKGIPYTVAEGRATMQEALVNDFYSIINLALYPYDKLSETAVNNSPLGGIEEASDIAQKVMKVLKEGSIAKTLDYIWNDLGYRQFIITNPSNQVYSEHYDYLYSLGCTYDANNWNVVKFLDYIRPLLGQQGKTRSEVFMREECNGVDLMTIHKSKGLERQVVIVAGMYSAPNNTDSGFVFATDNHCIMLPSFIAEGKLRNSNNLLYPDIENKKEEAELKRLLYVAATRAQYHLIFSGDVWKKRRKDGDKPDLSDIFVKATDFDWENGVFCNNEINNLVSDKKTYSIIEYDKTLSKKRADIESVKKNTPWFEDVYCFTVDYSDSKVGVTSLTEEIQASVGNKKEVLPRIESDDLILKHSLQTNFGTMTHRAIECFIKNIDFDCEAIDKVSEEEMNRLVNDCKKLAGNFINGSLYKTIKENYDDIYSELRFQLYDESSDCIVEGSMDFVAVNRSNVLVVDFKTDSVKDPSVHEAQLGWYKKAALSLFPGKEVSAQVVYLREKL